MIIKKFKKLCEKILRATKKYYKDRLITVAIYGSVGREAVNYESDIDLLIIAKNLPKGRVKRLKEFNVVERKLEKSLNQVKKYNIYTYISPIFKTPEEVNKGSPLFLDMIYDIKILYDKNNFFTSYLLNLKKRLDELGAKRVYKGNLWYWDLKPDYKFGETFRIC